MRSGISSLLASALLALAVCGCAAYRAPATDGLDHYLQDLSRRDLFQGAVVVGVAGRVVYARGFGFADAERDVAFTPDTRNDGASITKTFTAAAILALWHEGRVDLDAPVQRYLADYPHAATRVRHLIGHSAGLPDYDWFDRYQGPPAARSNADQLALLRRESHAPAFPPGSRFAYDNVAYDSAALLVERVSAMSFEAFLRERFLGPLGLRDAFVRPASLGAFPGTRTVGYRRGGRGAERFDAFEGESFHGGGNLYLSAMDLHRWAVAFASRSVLPGPALARGLERAALDDGRRMRLTLLSWYPSSDGRRHYYFGHHQGFYNFAYWDARRDISIAFVSNGNVAANLPVELPRALIAFAEGRSPQPAALVTLAEPSPAEIAGPWFVEGLGAMTVRQEGRIRHLVSADGVEYRMFRFSPGLYAVPGFDAWMRFHREQGKVALFWDSVYLAAPANRH